MAWNKGKGKLKEDGPMLNAIPSPVATFDISDEQKLKANFDKCVKSIIAEMDRSTDVRFKFDLDGEDLTIPVTPGEDNTSHGTYVIEITDGKRSLYLVGTKYQSWFRGFVTDKGRRYEVGEVPPRGKVMKGSKSLHSDGMYPHLITGGVAALRVGYQRLFRAFHSLATHGEDGNEEVTAETKEDIAVLLVMLFEGPRFPAVCNFVKDLLGQRRDDTVRKTRGNLINNWCGISEKFYEAEKGKDERITISPGTLQAVKDAAHNLRIMCRSKWENWLAKQRGTAGGSSSRSKK